MCAPRPPGVVGGVAPRALGSGNPPRALARNSEHRVCLSQAGVWADLPQSPKGTEQGGGEGARDPRPGRSFPGPRTSGGAPPADPGPGALPQVAAGIVLVVVLGLRVPEQHGWGSEPGPTQARGGRDAGRANLQATCQQRCSPRGPPALRIYGRLGGRGVTRPRPQAARPPHLVTRTGAPFPGASAPPGRRPRACAEAGIWPGAAPIRPRGWGPGNRPRSPGVFPLPEPHRGWGEEAVSLRPRPRHAVALTCSRFFTALSEIVFCFNLHLSTDLFPSIV